METKPYNLQSPEAIAKEYGGNKMKIAQAAQIGLLDPTAAVLAGMFIDRMRGAQQQEQAPQRTVAQQVLAPQPASQAPMGAGLGATPQAAQMAAAYPAEGAPPPVPGPSMPQQEPVMAADGGLMSLPVDDAMFQPSYNAGGIVAFADGGVASSGGPTDAADRKLQEYRQAGAEHQEKQRLRNQIIEQYGLKSGVLGPLTSQSGAERETAQRVMSRIFQMSIPELRAVIEQGPRALSAEQPSYNSGGVVAFAAGSEGPIQGSYSGKFEELPEYRRPLAGSMGEFFSNMFSPSGQRIDPVTGEPIYLGEFLRRQEAERAKSAAPIAAQMAAATTRPVPPTPTIKPDIKVPDTAVAAPTEKGAAPSGLGSLAVGMPAAPKVGSAQKALEPMLKDYMGRTEEREKRLMEALGRDRLQGKALEGYEKQLQQDAEAAGMEKEDAKNMALFKAGLAMMSGTSPNAFENIGKGALTGVADYQEALKNLKKAERERAKESALIEQARRAESQGELKRRDDLLMRSSDAAQAREDFRTKAMMEAGVKDQDRAFQLQRDLFAGGLQLQAAQARNEALTSAAGQKMDTVGQAQLAKLYQEARQQITEPQIRALVAKRDKLDLNKIPPDDPEFNARVDAAYRAAIERYVRLNTPSQPDANPYPNFIRLPASN